MARRWRRRFRLVARHEMDRVQLPRRESRLEYLDRSRCWRQPRKRHASLRQSQAADLVARWEIYVLPLTGEAIRSSDTDIKFEKPTNAVTVQIDFKDISRRIRKVASQSPSAD